MKDKIQIEEIRNYINVNLQCSLMGEYTEETQFDDKPEAEIFTIQGVVKDITDTFYCYCDNEEHIYERQLDEVFPHVRPLSQLTQEIEVGGKRIVPIVELTKLLIENIEEFGSVKFYGATKIHSDDNIYSIDFLFNNENESTHKFTIDFYGNYPLLTMTRNIGFSGASYIQTLNYGLFFQKLFEWHFDVFGWIEKGLAIEKK